MAIPKSCDGLIGHWQGSNHLWLAPDQPSRISAISAVVTRVVNDRFLCVSYQWREADKPEEGMLLVGRHEQNDGDAPRAIVEMSWVDSWHNGNRFMHCRGENNHDTQVSAVATYAETWRWRLTLVPLAANRWQWLMHNITPAGEEHLAVRADFTRR